MIYCSQLAPYVKKSLGNKAFQTNVSKIAETLPIDPAISNMDAIVIGPKDIGGLKGRVLLRAIAQKHPSVGIIFIYSKDKEAEALDGDVKKIKVKKITPEIVEEAIQEMIELKEVSKDNRVIVSSDTKIPSPEVVTPELSDAERNMLVTNHEVASTVTEETPELTLSVTEPEPFRLTEEVILEDMRKKQEVVETKSLENQIKELNEFGDWDFFKKSLEKDSVLRELMHENTQYAGVINMLEVIDKKIANVFKDTSLSAEERFDEIKKLGLEKSSYKGLDNNIVVDKVINIMDAIVHSAQATVDRKVNNIRKAMDTIAKKKMMYEDQSTLRALIDERLKIQTELMELAKNIIETYKTMDYSVGMLIESFENDLPSSNAYINEIMKPVKNIFLPQNVATLATRLMKDLQSNRVSMAALEGSVTEVITLLFKLCDTDNTIIEYQQKLIDLLQAQKVEDVVIIDSMIKNSLRVFVGTSDSGRTATTLTWAGMMSRRQNSVLIDLTGSSKLAQYGVNPVSLDDFLNERIERQFLCVEGNIDHDLERIDEILNELKTRLNYYPFITIVLSDKQKELLHKLSPSTLSVHFLTDCTPKSIGALNDIVASYDEDNVARKVILIEPPIDPISIINNMGVDPLLTKLIIIPRLSHIAACSLKGLQPHDNREVLEIFEEAFR